MFPATPPHYLPITLAAHFNLASLVFEFLEQDQNLLEAKTPFNETPLYEAARGHAFEVVELLLNCHANVNCEPNKYGDTPLTASLAPGPAWFFGTSGAVGPNITALRLLEAGAESQRRFHVRRNIIHYLARQSNASWESDRPVAQRLLEMGYTSLISQVDLFHQTPIHDAAWWGATELLRCMIEDLIIREPHRTGPTLDMRDGAGFTAMHYACRDKNNQFALHVLSKHVKDWNIKSEGLTLTPLHYAILMDNIDAVRILLTVSSGVNPNQADSGGRTPLHLAVMKDSAPLINLLLDGGADAISAGDIELKPMELGWENWRLKAV